MSSKVGMIVGAALVLAVGLFIMNLVFFPSPSDPTNVTMAPGALDRVEMSKPLEFVLGSVPTGGGNAGDDYQKALQLYRTNREMWKDVEKKIAYVKGGSLDVIGPKEFEHLKAMVDHCHRGAQKAEMKFCIPHGQPPVISYDQADSLAMIKIMGYLEVYVDYTFRKARSPEDAKEAETAAKDLLIMGWHASRERVYPAMTAAGFAFQKQACQRLDDIYSAYPSLAPSGDAVSRVQAYGSAARMAMADSQRLATMWTIDPKPGDFFNVIENVQDPAWRVQGLLGLGMIRYRVEGHRGDRLRTQELLEKYSTSGTEMEKRAAKAALSFTREDYRRIGTLKAPEP